MKKIALLLIIACILAQSLMGCVADGNNVTDGDNTLDNGGATDGEQTTPPVEEYFLERPETNLEFWITENVDNVDLSKYPKGRTSVVSFIYGSQYTIKYTNHKLPIEPTYYVKYGVCKYPDVSDKSRHIIIIKITDPKVNAYGLTVESTPEEFKAVMEEYGFVIEEDLQGPYATKGRFSIGLNLVKKYLIIRADVDNKHGVIFD